MTLDIHFLFKLLKFGSVFGERKGGNILLKREATQYVDTRCAPCKIPTRDAMRR